MTLLDAFAVIALLRAEPATPQVRQLLADTDGVAMAAVGLAEVVDHLVRVGGSSEEDAVMDVAQLGLADAVPTGDAIAFDAGLLRARHYHRRDRAVSLADCVLAATARAADARVATADPHLLDMCAAEGIAVVALPDARGRTWRENGSAEPPE